MRFLRLRKQTISEDEQRLKKQVSQSLIALNWAGPYDFRRTTSWRSILAAPRRRFTLWVCATTSQREWPTARLGFILLRMECKGFLD